MRQVVVAALAALCLLVSAPAASAGQLRAKTDPAAGGDISTPAKGCERHDRKRNGNVVARGVVCSWFFFMRDGHATRDFGIIWVQATVAPVKGWCVKEADLDMTIGHNQQQYETTAPSKSRKVLRNRTTTRKLVATARDTMSDPGVIEQSLVLRRGRYALHHDLVEEGQLFRQRWTGTTTRKLALVSGAEVSWDAALGRPGFGRGLAYTMSRRNC